MAIQDLPRTRALLEAGIARKEQLGAQLALSRGAAGRGRARAPRALSSASASPARR